MKIGDTVYAVIFDEQSNTNFYKPVQSTIREIRVNIHGVAYLLDGIQGVIIPEKYVFADKAGLGRWLNSQIHTISIKDTKTHLLGLHGCNSIIHGLKRRSMVSDIERELGHDNNDTWDDIAIEAPSFDGLYDNDVELPF